MTTNRIPGIVEVIELETADTRAIPSAVMVHHMLLRTVMDADMIDHLLAKISSRLMTLKKWQHRGFVNQDEIENLESWFEAKNHIISYMMNHRSGDLFHFYDTYMDGAGI